ncbi:MAG: hypothetical protein QG635_547, partial [Bacteroidota bacterium]|nr:hypothetical protein [Bacteroidota bacterium]
QENFDWLVGTTAKFLIEKALITSKPNEDFRWAEFLNEKVSENSLNNISSSNMKEVDMPINPSDNSGKPKKSSHNKKNEEEPNSYFSDVIKIPKNKKEVIEEIKEPDGNTFEPQPNNQVKPRRKRKKAAQ